MALVDLGRVTDRITKVGQSGSFTATAQAITEKQITFLTPFSEGTSVLVFLALNTLSDYPYYGNLSFGVANITNTGFTIRVFNNSERDLVPNILWYAAEVL